MARSEGAVEREYRRNRRAMSARLAEAMRRGRLQDLMKDLEAEAKLELRRCRRIAREARKKTPKAKSILAAQRARR